MNATERLDRVVDVLVRRRAELERILAMKDETAAFHQNTGFAFLVRGPERIRVEAELRSVQALMELARADRR